MEAFGVSVMALVVTKGLLIKVTEQMEWFVLTYVPLIARFKRLQKFSKPKSKETMPFC